MRMKFNDTELEITPNGKDFTVTLGGKTIHAEVLHSGDGMLDLRIDGKRLTAYISADNAKRWVTIHGQTCVLTKPTAGLRKGGHTGHAVGELSAPMPGQIRAVHVSEGDKVAKGQTLLVIEAMKMEIRVQAPIEGVVKKLFVGQGQTVEREQILVEIDS